MKAVPEANTKINVEYIENNYVEMPIKWPSGRPQ